MYSLICLVQAGLIAMMPVWFATKAQRGGLGYSVIDRAYVISAGALIVYIVHYLCGSRLTYILNASPVSPYT
jgi:hypothetical protein